MKYIIAIFLVFVSMFSVFAFIKSLARELIGFVCLAAMVLACYIISKYDGLMWYWILIISAVAGFAGGIICIPVLPYAGMDEIILDAKGKTVKKKTPTKKKMQE